jgi:sigma-B regulation protein RsbU (phosphoserine phosphatase)
MNRPFKVLVIDDDALMRMTLRAYLEDSGYSVVEAEDGEQGMELFNRERPDIVLTDLRMPKMDGFEVIARLKRDSPGTPIIAITGTGDEDTAAEAVRRGACDALLKPINDLSILEAVIARALDRPKRERI